MCKNKFYFDRFNKLRKNWNNGQDLTINYTEVTDMPSFREVGQAFKTKISGAIERQINEQLFQKGAITREMYEAAKASLELADQRSFEE